MSMSMPKPEEYGGVPPAYTDADAELLLDIQRPPTAESPSQRLDLPLCLPQTTSGYDSPFARAYNPQLEASGIEQDEWLKFLDALNIAMTASPPLRVVDMAGMVIGFVPYHWAIIAGVLTQTIAQTAMHVIQKTLTDRLLKHANSTFFEPRGLKVRLMKTEAMRRFVGIDSADGPSASKAKRIAKTVGHGIESVAYRLPIPFLGRVVSALTHPSGIDPNSPYNVTERRMVALQGYITPVSFDVPPAKMPEAIMDKASELCIKLRLWQGKRADTKAMRNRRMLAIAEGRSQPTYYGVSEYNDRRSRRAERRARNGRSGKHVRKLRGQVAKADRLEANATDGLVWVVLMNADQDIGIEGRELADNLEDEQIDDDEWAEEIELEEVEDEKVAMDARKTMPSTLQADK
jgi:hypothetical protein